MELFIILNFFSAWLAIKKYKACKFYYRKRGSASYIVREVLSVRERERDTEREREREREKDGSDVTIVALKLAMNTLSLAKNSHNWTYSRYGFIVGEFPSPGLTAGRNRPSLRSAVHSFRLYRGRRASFLGRKKLE